MPGTMLGIDTVISLSCLLSWQGPVLLDLHLPRCSGTVAIPLPSLRVSYYGSKPTVVILISIVSDWFGIRRVLQSWSMGSLQGAFWEQLSPT